MSCMSEYVRDVFIQLHTYQSSLRNYLQEQLLVVALALSKSHCEMIAFNVVLPPLTLLEGS